MPIVVKRHKTGLLISLEGQITLASAAELKKLLLEGLAGGNGVELDLGRADEIDITTLQLMWAAVRAGVKVAAPASAGVAAAVRDSGFAQTPGFPPQE
jgi:anti-anti-sigma regulatory factor